MGENVPYTSFIEKCHFCDDLKLLKKTFACKCKRLKTPPLNKILARILHIYEILKCHQYSCCIHTFSEKAEEKTEFHLNPIKVLHIAEEMLDENSIIVADGGDFVGSAAYILRLVFIH
jgi:hypothetical protein